jgi:hypothetical protein
MKTVKKTDLAWAAGFIDGDGYIGITRTDKRNRDVPEYYLKLRAGQKFRKPLNHLQALFGCGYVGYSTRPHSEWNVNHHESAKVLRLILPYLIVKKREAELALDFYELKENQPRIKKEGIRTGFETVPMEYLAQRDAYYWALREAKVIYR